MALAVERMLPRVAALGARKLEAPCRRFTPKCVARSGCSSSRLSRLGSGDRQERLGLQLDGHSVLGLRHRGSRNVSAAAADPLFFLGYTEGVQVLKFYNDWKPSEESIKSLYMIIACFFSWGCCVFGSMKDPFYDSEGYRADGGNGTQYYFYDRAEVVEENARAELWREELLQEIESKMGELGEAEEFGKLPIDEEKVEKEIELV